MRRHDGVYEWFKARGQPLRDAAGTIAGWLGVVINIEDLKRAETALRDSEERFRTLADHMSQLAWMTDETGWFFWYNRRWYAYTGTTLEQVQGWGWKRLHHPEHVDRVVAKIAHCFATGETWEDTFPLRGKDGAYRWFLSRAIPIRDTAGRIVRWFGTNTDISELREAEEALRASERQLSLVMDMAPVHIAYLDPHGKYRYVNRAYAERLGLRPEDVVGRHVTEVLGPEIWKQVEQHVAEVLAGRPVEFETSVPYPQAGMRHVHARYAPEVDAAGTVQGFVAVVTDITAQRELEQQRAALLESERSARTALERAMRAKDEFLSVVNHELRSPLAVVLGWTRMLRDGKLSGDELQEAVESIWRGGEQLKHLIDDLLDTSRALAGKLKVNPAPVDLGALARQAVADHQPEARERDVRLTEELPAGEFLVLADAGRLRQVIGNLLSNALKFTPAGGRVRLRVLPSRSRVMIAVEDTGIGIDPDVLPRLFERFRQADSSIARKYKGLGLGLALVKQIVEMHGGHVHAESGGMSQGATFMVELPRLESVAQAPGSSGWDVDLTGVRVLAVDDDPAALGLTARLLEECGATVRRCYSGAEALEVLAAGGFDLLISDVSMPEMDGYTLLRKVRALPSVHAGLPAIAVTAFGREEDERRSLEAGFVAHHTKPLNPAELCAGVQVLAKRNGRAEFRADGEKSLVIGGAD